MNTIRLTKDGGVLTVTLTNVAERNSMGPAMLSELYEAIEGANAAGDVYAVVVTNEGNTFCAGANLKQRSGSQATDKPLRNISIEELLAAIQTSATPVIGRIAGHVVGGGNGLAASFDISIAAEDVTFGFSEVRLGVTPAIISVVCLPKMRRGDAMELFLRGNRFSGKRAAEVGLINRAVAEDQLDAAVEEVLSDLRKGGPNALGIAKRLVNEVPAMDQAAAFEMTAKLSAECFASDEAQEGMAAFLQKRPARWTEV